MQEDKKAEIILNNTEAGSVSLPLILSELNEKRKGKMMKEITETKGRRERRR